MTREPNEAAGSEERQEDKTVKTKLTGLRWFTLMCYLLAAFSSLLCIRSPDNSLVLISFALVMTGCLGEVVNARLKAIEAKLEEHFRSHETES